MTRKTEAHRVELNKRLAEVLLHSAAHRDDGAVQLARQELMSELPWFNNLLLQVQAATKLKRLIDQADLRITVMRLCMFAAMAGLMAGLAVRTVSSSNILMIIAGLAASALPFMHVVWKRNKRLHRFLELLPDALDLMGRSLAAGHAFQESLHMVATEMPEPIATEFRKAYEEQNLGLSLKLALENLVDRVPLLDLRMCVTAVMIQRETGGNLAEILGKVAHTIRERFRILRDLKTLTTSSRWSAWLLCGLPPLTACMVTYLDPEYMSVFWSDPRGHRMLALAIFMQITGMLLVRKIMRIRI